MKLKLKTITNSGEKRNYIKNLKIENYNCQKTNKEIILSLEHQPKRVKLESQMEKIKSQFESIKLKLKLILEN